MIPFATLSLGLEKSGSRSDEQRHAGKPAVGDSKDQVPETAVEELAQVSRVGAKRASDFGEEFLTAIADYTRTRRQGPG